MKTSYEISKKLNYAGFKAKSDTIIHDPNNPIIGERYASFCLETILEALPRTIKVNELRVYLSLDFSAGRTSIGYSEDESEEYLSNLYDWKQENESLATTAGRLWLKLKEEGLV